MLRRRSDRSPPANGPTSSPPTCRAPTLEAGEVAIWHAAQLRSHLSPAGPGEARTGRNRLTLDVRFMVCGRALAMVPSARCTASTGPGDYRCCAGTSAVAGHASQVRHQRRVRIWLRFVKIPSRTVQPADLPAIVEFGADLIGFSGKESG